MIPSNPRWRSRHCVCAIAFALAALCAASAAAQEWGHLKGRFVLAGKAPAPVMIVVEKDHEVCAPGGKGPLEEKLVVGKDNGIANVLVELMLKPADKIEIHPSYAEAAKAPVVMDNIQCRFVPRVAVVRTGQDLVLKNSDKVGHNFLANLLAEDKGKGQAFNEQIAPGGQLTKVLPAPEKMARSVVCGSHPWMKAFLVVRKDPYAAVSSDDGRFEIKNLPAGEWTFRLWHEAGYVSDVNVAGTKTPRQGTFKVTIASEQSVDLGDIKVPVKFFE